VLLKSICWSIHSFFFFLFSFLSSDREENEGERREWTRVFVYERNSSFARAVATDVCFALPAYFFLHWGRTWNNSKICGANVRIFVIQLFLPPSLKGGLLIVRRFSLVALLVFFQHAPAQEKVKKKNNACQKKKTREDLHVHDFV
jgi:hypothetical protein